MDRYSRNLKYLDGRELTIVRFVIDYLKVNLFEAIDTLRMVRQ
jgi:hypothetical protein